MTELEFEAVTMFMIGFQAAQRLRSAMKRRDIENYSRAIAKMGMFPIFFYFTFFFILTYPLLLQFSTHLFADLGDGLLNVWNIWWTNKSVTELHQLPYSTTFVHYPFGASLYGHPLNPFNGMMGILLLRILTLTKTYNAILIFSFVIGGYTAFLLSWYFTKSYWGSLIAGYVFTFSNYHFAHAEGHLNLVALEWLPLFVLCWYVLITKPRVLMGLVSGIVLFAVILCDYYYFLYAVIIACVIFAWYGIYKRNLLFFLGKTHFRALIVFLLVTLVTAGPLIISLMVLNERDPLLGAHPPEEYSLDLLALLIPGGHWRFADLTSFYWSKLPLNKVESSVHLGLSVICALLYVGLKGRKLSLQNIGLWYSVFISGLLLSLGPVLHVWGIKVPFVVLPYAILDAVLSPLRLSGVPVRMIVIPILAASVISAIAFKILFHQSTVKRLLGCLWLVVLFVEYLPSPIPSYQIPIPGYVYLMKDLPNDSGIIDTESSPAYTWSLKMYYQTIHEKPVAFGYLSRIQKSVFERENSLRQIIRNGDYLRLCRDYNLRYLLTDAGSTKIDNHPEINLIYQDNQVKLYDLGKETICGIAKD